MIDIIGRGRNNNMDFPYYFYWKMKCTRLNDKRNIDKFIEKLHGPNISSINSTLLPSI